jgi:NADPH:quinone reductase-like Zn-dependent oxidoreductase
MRLRNKILGTTLLVAVVAVVAMAAAVSYDLPCEAAPPLPAGTSTMKATVNRCYGSADVVAIEDVAKPVPTDNEVLVKVRAASVNALDWHSLRGEPYFIRAFSSGLGRPTNPRLGVDYAGIVEAVGKNVTRFRPGDEVFGGRSGALAEYVVAREDRAIVSKPANVTFEQAAAVPVAAITALQALRDHGGIRAGQKVLINGASGGVGTFAVQIAKALGAEVTAVCSTRNVEQALRIGADHVVDYTGEDFTLRDARYDLIVDMAGSHSPLTYRRVLTADGKLVVVGNASRDPWIGALAAIVGPVVYDPFVSQEMLFFIAQLNQADLALLAELMRDGKLTSVVDRVYASADVREALRYIDEGHARGKVIVTFD